MPRAKKKAVRKVRATPTPEQAAQAVEMYKGGAQGKDITRKLGLSKGSLYKALHEAGVALRGRGYKLNEVTPQEAHDKALIEDGRVVALPKVGPRKRARPGALEEAQAEIARLQRVIVEMLYERLEAKNG